VIGDEGEPSFAPAQPGSSFFRDLEDSARAYAADGLQRFVDGFSVSASGPAGFDMWLTAEKGCYTLRFDDWIEEFECAETAREIFEAALRGEARVRIDMLADQRWRWTLERRDASGTWLPESTLSRAIWRFWGRETTIYLRNEFPETLPPNALKGDVGVKAN
jgi:hypothetical protein